MSSFMGMLIDVSYVAKIQTKTDCFRGTLDATSQEEDSIQVSAFLHGLFRRTYFG